MFRTPEIARYVQVAMFVRPGNNSERLSLIQGDIDGFLNGNNIDLIDVHLAADEQGNLYALVVYGLQLLQNNEPVSRAAHPELYLAVVTPRNNIQYSGHYDASVLEANVNAALQGFADATISGIDFSVQPTDGFLQVGVIYSA